MPAIFPILCDTAVTGGTTGTALTAVAGTSLTTPSRPMSLLGYVGFGLNPWQLDIHNTSWPSPIPHIRDVPSETASSYPRMRWFSPTWVTKNSVWLPHGYTTGNEDMNLILYLLDEGVALQHGWLDLRPIAGNPYSFHNLPQPGKWRVLWNTETPAAANVFEEMQGITIDNSYLSSDCDYYIISANAHSATAGAARFIKIRSINWPMENAPVFPCRADTAAYTSVENAYAFAYVHKGTETLFFDIYNASTEATRAYVVVWEHKVGR